MANVRETIMEDGINIKVESKCSTCAYGSYDEEQQPCLKCFESDIRFSQWMLNPNYDVNRKNKTSLQDKGNEVLLL